MLTSTVVTPIRLYPLHHTLYCCTLTPTLTRRQSSVPVALSPSFVSDILFQVLQCTLHWLHLSPHFLLTISFRNQQFFPNSFSVGSKQRATTALDFEHFFHCSQFSYCSLHSLTLFALTFLCVSHSNLVIFCSVPNLPHLSQFVHSFALQWFPIFFTLLGTSAQQNFGHCQPFPTLQT